MIVSEINETKKDEALEERICRNCEEPFSPSRKWQVFCSEKCRNMWHYERLSKKPKGD